MLQLSFYCKELEFLVDDRIFEFVHNAYDKFYIFTYFGRDQDEYISNLIKSN